ncbi:hypothetical protein, partial [Pseudonocardia sp. McavD-2-B]|uniref:hypothetical protein n=1 Tax=Pseudonocardia sp. McavD-2-B TaxID=2954499 RepID=UPI0035AB85AB|nr:hypothetical protein [Pseudonocardia sp. McavD-2-B]
MALQPQMIDATVGGADDSGTFTLDRPDGLVAGDLLSFFASYSFDGGAPTPPAGFDVVLDDTSQNPDASFPNAPNVLVAHHWVTDPGAEPASYTATAQTSTSCVLVAARDVDPDAPIAEAFVSNSSPFAVTDVRVEARTLTTDDVLWLGAWSYQRYTEDRDNAVTLPGGVTEAGQHSAVWTFLAVGTEQRDAGAVPRRTAPAAAQTQTCAKGTSWALRGAPEQTDPEPERPTLVATYTAELVGGTMTTESFTPDPGELLVVKALAGHSLATLGAPAGGDLTYTSAATPVTLASYCPIRIDTARVGSSPAPMTVSVAVTNGGSYSPSLIVERWAGAHLDSPPATNNVRTGTTAQTMNPIVQATEGGSVITWAAGDWQAVSGGTPTYRSGAVANFEKRNSAVNYWSATQGVETAGGNFVGMSAPSGQKWSLLAVELLPVGETGPPTEETGTGTAPATTLDATGTGSAVRGGSGVPGTATLGATGAGEASRAGEGVAGVALSATGTGAGDRNGSGTAALTPGATGTGYRVATGTGSTGLTLDTAGQAERVATGHGSTAVALGQGAAGSKAGVGSGSVSAALSGSSVTERVERDGAGAAELLVDAVGDGQGVERVGAGRSGLTLDARGAGELTYYASTGFELDATGTGHRIATGSGAAGLALDTGGTGTSDRAGAGSTGLALDHDAAALTERTATGTAGLTLDTAGDGRPARQGTGSTGLTVGQDVDGLAERTGSGDAGLALDATGESRERSGTGEAVLEMGAAGHGHGRTATGTGTAGLALDATGTGRR